VSLWHSKFTIRAWEKHADFSLAAYASYTPILSGMFHIAAGDTYTISADHFVPEYYSSTAGAWFQPRTLDSTSKQTYGSFIGDGANFRIRNKLAVAVPLVMMRMGYHNPNPSPKVGKQTLYGKPSIVLESDERGFIWIEEESLTKLCEELFTDVQEAKEKGEPHELIGKTLLDAIKEDTRNKLGWRKYRQLLRDVGYE